MPNLNSHLMPTKDDIPTGFDLPETVTSNFMIHPSFVALIERNKFAETAKEDPSNHIRTSLIIALQSSKLASLNLSCE